MVTNTNKGGRRGAGEAGGRGGKGKEERRREI
jgi:hypothetical protein